MNSLLPRDDSHDSDKVITEMQVEADKHNAEMLQDDS
jgi:hypothetical protein